MNNAIRLGFLKYGMLVDAGSGKAISSEGLGVTSRSKDFDGVNSGMYRPHRLLGVQVFGSDMIDPAMGQRGALLMRSVPGPNREHRMVFARTRFRPEGGESANGRLHEQTTVWRLDGPLRPESIAGALVLAGEELRADPDYVQTSTTERFSHVPLTREISCPAPGLPDSEPALRMLDLLLPREFNTSEGNGITFGADVFDDEAGFLSALAAAIAQLPLELPCWHDFCVSSGICRESTGLSIRYLPSQKTSLGTPVPSRGAILERIHKARHPHSTRGNEREADGVTKPSTPDYVLSSDEIINTRPLTVKMVRNSAVPQYGSGERPAHWRVYR